MMMGDKKVHAKLIVRNLHSEISFTVYLERYIILWQHRVVVNNPDMILQMERYTKEEKR